jgi:hypothetical protein
MKRRIENKLEGVGEDLGGRLFEALRGDQLSPEIYRQKAYYAEQLGRSFLAYVYITVFPIVYYLLGRFYELLRHPKTPDTALFDLIYELPPLNLEVYGAFTVLAGSVFLASDIFDNFMEESLEDGTLLAIVHSGILFLIVGYSFQYYMYFDVSISEPGTGPYAVPEPLWFALDNLEYVMPFIVIPLTGLALTITYRFTIQNQFENTEQTRLNAERWECAKSED